MQVQGQAEAAYRITATFRLAEDKHAAAIHFPLQQLEKAGVLLRLSHKLEGLLDHVVGLEVCGADGDLVGILQEVPRDALHLLGPGGAPQQRLPVWTDLQALPTHSNGRPPLRVLAMFGSHVMHLTDLQAVATYSTGQSVIP